MNFFSSLFCKEYNSAFCQQERVFEESLPNARRLKQLINQQSTRLEALKVCSKSRLSDTEFFIREGIVNSLERGQNLRCVVYNLEELSHLTQESHQAIELYLPTIAYILQKCSKVPDRAHQELYDKVAKHFVPGLASQVSKAIRLYEQKFKVGFHESRARKVAAERHYRQSERQAGTLAKIAKVTLPLVAVTAALLGFAWYFNGSKPCAPQMDEYLSPAQLLLRSGFNPQNPSDARKILLLDSKHYANSDCQSIAQRMRGLFFLFFPTSPENNQATHMLHKAYNTAREELERRSICSFL